MLFFGAVRRRRARTKADIIESVAFGYSGVKTEKGNRSMQQQLSKLRES